MNLLAQNLMQAGLRPLPNVEVIPTGLTFKETHKPVYVGGYKPTAINHTCKFSYNGSDVGSLTYYAGEWKDIDTKIDFNHILNFYSRTSEETLELIKAINDKIIEFRKRMLKEV
jgi:hypothetical protein